MQTDSVAMASVMQPGRGIRLALFHAAVLVLALLSLMEVTDAVQWVAGGEVQKWSFLHANDAPTFFNDWANDNKTFQTGDTLCTGLQNPPSNHLQFQSKSRISFRSATSYVRT